MLIHNSCQAFNVGIICIFEDNDTGHFINTVFDAEDQTSLTGFLLVEEESEVWRQQTDYCMHNICDLSLVQVGSFVNSPGSMKSRVGADKNTEK